MDSQGKRLRPVCASHFEHEAVAICHYCRKPLCPRCVHRAATRVLCARCNDRIHIAEEASPPRGRGAGRTVFYWSLAVPALAGVAWLLWTYLRAG